MGYKYGIWLVYDQTKFNTNHIGHLTIACFMTKEDAYKLYHEIIEKCGDTFEVLIYGKSAFYDSAFYESETNKMCSWGYDGTCEYWDTFKHICEKYKCDFAYIPHTSIEYGFKPKLLKQESTHDTIVKCQVQCVDIRSDFPVDWKFI